MTSIKPALEHIYQQVVEAAMQGAMEVTLSANYELRSTSNSEFNDIVGHLKNHGYKVHFEQRDGVCNNDASHTLDNYYVTISWS